MKKIRVLKILTVVLMVALVIGIAKSSFAVTATIQPIENSGGNSSNNVVNNVANEPVNNTPAPTPTPAPVNNTPLPDTGAKSSTGLFVLMVLTSISAVYTYIKVKEYNV